MTIWMIISVFSRQLGIFSLASTLATSDTVVYTGEEDFGAAPIAILALVVAVQGKKSGQH